MEVFFKTHAQLVRHIDAAIRRSLMDEIDWGSRLIGIKGARGVGKTTLLLQYAKEHFDPDDHRCLYINIDDLYFQCRKIVDFAEVFYKDGGRVLLIDNVFKQTEWSASLKRCLMTCPKLQIVFTCPSMTKLSPGNADLDGLVRSYELPGLSLREYINIMTGADIKPVPLEKIMSRREKVWETLLSRVPVADYFNDYLHHGYYPSFRQNGNNAQTLIKAINTTMETDMLLTKQGDLRYLAKIKKLFYLLALAGGTSPNVSALAKEMRTSRATIVNYMKHLADARLLDIVYSINHHYPHKPSKVLIGNTNIINAMPTVAVDEQVRMETFFVSAVAPRHEINQHYRDYYYFIDKRARCRVCDANARESMKYVLNTYYVEYNTFTGTDKTIPIWLFGFLY